MVTKVLKKRPKNIQLGIILTEFSQELEQIHKTISISYFILGKSAFKGCSSILEKNIPPIV